LVYAEKHVHVHEGSTVKGTIYTLDHFDTKGKKESRISMIGQFIGKDIHSDYTTWNWGTNCSGSCNFKRRNMLAENNASDFLKEGEVRLNIYPNPSDGQFKIDINSEQKGNLRVTIYNPLGQEMKAIYDPEFNGNALIDVDLTYSTSTYYLVKVELPNETITRKVVIYK
jgi:hypothetical protein